jgi:hypothetical protein
MGIKGSEGRIGVSKCLKGLMPMNEGQGKVHPRTGHEGPEGE